MYESYFGFSATPFNLNPDPGFYFESRGHGHALSYLKFGVYQGEGFVVVTGEIGAGKTTLVRTLLAGVDPKEIVAAQIVSTQLDAGDLLRSVALAFGIPPKNLSKAELIATIEAFLTELVLQKKRALLVVDEAQNLNLMAIEELRMLSNFQLGNHALLQSFLIGQPELRALLTSKPMEQLRQRVIASCHLGPMERQETEAYVRHRLGVVGWTGDRPGFDNAAFDQIFEWTGGVPRRVNLLCNRLLLATFLQSRTEIDGEAVRTIAREVLSEVGEAPPMDPMPPDELVPAAAEEPVAIDIDLGDLRTRLHASGRAGPLLLVAASRADDAKLAVLMRALKPRKGLPAMAQVRLGDATLLGSAEPLPPGAAADEPVVSVPVAGATSPARLADAIARFESVLDELRPSAVVVAGAGDGALAVALVCHKKGVKLVQADAGRRIGRPSQDVNSALIEQMAEVFYAPDKAAFDLLSAAGAPKSRVLQAGNLLGDAVRLCRAVPLSAADILASIEEVQPWLADKRGFGVIGLSSAIDTTPRDELAEYLAVARQVSQDLPLVWPIGEDVWARLDALGLRNLVDDSRIVLIQPLAYPDMIALMADAALAVTDSHHVEAEAAALGVPCLRLDQDQEAAAATRPSNGRKGTRNVLTLTEVKKIVTGPVRTLTPPKELDGHAAERIAEHLTQWLLSSALVAQLVKT